MKLYNKYFDWTKKYLESTKTWRRRMLRDSQKHEKKMHGVYLWKVHSIAHGGPELYRSTVTAPTRRIATIGIRQGLPAVSCIPARRSLGIHVRLRLGPGAIRRGRLVELCANGIHDLTFNTTFSDSCMPYVVNHGSAAAPLTTAIREGRGMQATRAHSTKTILATAGHRSDWASVSRGITFLAYGRAYLSRRRNVDFRTVRTCTLPRFPPS